MMPVFIDCDSVCSMDKLALKFIFTELEGWVRLSIITYKHVAALINLQLCRYL